MSPRQTGPRGAGDGGPRAMLAWALGTVWAAAGCLADLERLVRRCGRTCDADVVERLWAVVRYYHERNETALA